ncbi:type 1 glutamine amidotransferase domain-containing protein [uncultured Lacinutrix sp.]|uniref:type 1 glutamine amidotransferase domain-containing protein n=1 Tax=uncultured Lacinutrix sp. TaxID=574032 RepID=UPI0026338BC6|nr:type 1 glutamine amidotransferase domain-containing protein [uncultured Lacinutrix sp.]
MRLFILFYSIILFTGCSNTSNIEDKTSEKILFIVSNQHTYGDTDMNTSNHFGEIVYAYDILVNGGYKVDFVSPNGGAIPIGYLATSNSIQKKYLYDFNFMKKLKNTLKPVDILPSAYKAVYYVGGGAAMFGVPENKNIQDITMSIYNNNGIVSAICHGTAGIVNLKAKNGDYLYKGRDVNGFPDVFENKAAKYYETFPFSIEQLIKERGGNFSYSNEGWDNYYKVDKRLITGQDPTAAASVAKKIIQTLKQS